MAYQVAMSLKGAIVVVIEIAFLRYAVARVINQRSLNLTKHYFHCLPFECEPTAGISLYCEPITRPRHSQINIVTNPSAHARAHDLAPLFVGMVGSFGFFVGVGVFIIDRAWPVAVATIVFGGLCVA